jgi:hypothetical protein
MCELYSPYENEAKTKIIRASYKRCDVAICPTGISRSLKDDYDIEREIENLDWSQTSYAKDVTS